METWIKINIGAAILFAIIMIIGLITSNILGSGSNEQPEVTERIIPIAILSERLENDDEGNIFILGLAQNTGEAKLNYTEINAEFYNKAGNLMTKSFDKILDFEPGQNRSFKIVYPGVEGYNIVSYKVSVGNVW